MRYVFQNKNFLALKLQKLSNLNKNQTFFGLFSLRSVQLHGKCNEKNFRFPSAVEKHIKHRYTPYILKL